MDDREQTTGQGRNIFEALFSYVKRDASGTQSLPETSPLCADTPPTPNSGLDECDSPATSAPPNHTPSSCPSELNNSIPTLTENCCPLKSFVSAPSSRSNAFDIPVFAPPSSPCLSLRQLDVTPPAIPSSPLSHGEPNSPVSAVPTNPDTSSLPSTRREQSDLGNVPSRPTSPPGNTATSSEYQSRIAAYLRPLWSYPGVPLSPPLTDPPPPSEEEEEGRGSGCSTSKSFLCEKDLTEALASLLPPSTNFTQLHQARSCCTGLRYPPALAAAMSLLPLREEAQVTVTYNSSSNKPNGCRARDQGFLEIDASHFDPTSLVGMLGSPQLGAHPTMTVEDISDSSCSSSVTNTRIETSVRGASRKVGRHYGGSIGRAGRPRRPALRYTPEPKPRPSVRGFRHTSMRVGRPPGSRLMRRLSVNDKMERQLPLVDSLSETLWIDSPDDAADCDAFKKLSDDERNASPMPSNQADPGPSALQTRVEQVPSFPSIRNGDSTGRCPSASDSDQSWLALLRRFKIGEPLLDEIYRRFSSDDVLPEVIRRRVSFAISSDILTEFPCAFGRPHTVMLNMRHLVLLAGDAIRLIALAMRSQEPSIMDVAKSYLTVCQQQRRSALLDSIRVRTPDGLRDPSHYWPQLFGPKSCLRDLRSLQVVPCPPESMLEALMRSVKKACFKGVDGTSWNLCCTPAELCDTILQVASPPTELDSSSTGFASRDEIIPSCLNTFLSLHSGANVDFMSESALLHLAEFVPTRLIFLSRALHMKDQSKALGGIGLICRVFRRLYAHLFLLDPSLGLRLLREESPSGTGITRGTLFTHLKDIHSAVADCLARLRNSYASLVSAGACLSALHRLRCAAAYSSLDGVSRTINFCCSHGNAVNPLDEGRSRLFDSAVHARQNVARILRDELTPSLLRLLFAVSGAYNHLVWVVMNDLFMFRSKRGIKLQTQCLSSRSNNACWLMDTGLSTLNFLDRTVTENPNLWCSGYRDVLKMCKAQFLVLKQPGLLDEMNKLLVQLKDFRCSLHKTRNNLAKLWLPSFRGYLQDEEVDCRADHDIKLMTTLLQYQFDLVEKWSRSVNNVELPPVARNMANIILRLADQEGRKTFSRLGDAVPETLEIPYGSKNSQRSDWFSRPFELPSLCEWPPGQPTVKASSPCDRESDRDLPVISLESPLRSVLVDEFQHESTSDLPSTTCFTSETEIEKYDSKGNEETLNASTKRHVSIKTPLMPETGTETSAPTAFALPTYALSSVVDRRLLGRQNRMQKMRAKEHELNNPMETVPLTSNPRKSSTLTPAGLAARGKRMRNGSVNSTYRTKRLLLNKPTETFNDGDLSHVVTVNAVDNSAAQMDVLPFSAQSQEVAMSGVQPGCLSGDYSGEVFSRPPPAAEETFPSTIDLTLED
ncbi:hypothetical protein SprV_0301287700 [Sparganum proliferum]